MNGTFKLLHDSAVAMTGGQDAIGVLPQRELAEVLGVTVLIHRRRLWRPRGEVLPS